MKRLFWVLLFLIPFQARIYKFLKPMSLSWLDSTVGVPPFFEPYADLYITDFLLLMLALKKIRINTALVVFLGASLFSIVISEYYFYPISYWRWAHLALASLLVFAMPSWRVSFKSIAQVVVISGVIQCCIALPQYLTQHQLGLKIAGEPTLVSVHAITSHFWMPKKGVTAIDYLLTSSESPAAIIRAYGTLPHPNILGGFLLFSIFMTLFLYEQSSKKGWIAAAIFLQLITLFTTYSRAALFALIGGVIIWTLLQFLKERKIPSCWKPVTLGLSLSFLLFHPQLFHRGGVISYNQVAAQSDQMRLSMQEVATLMIKDHPWFGVGFNNYLLALPKYAQGAAVDSIAVHNIYLLIAAETGVTGLACFLIFCGFVLYRGWEKRATPEGRTLLALFIAILAIGLADHYPILVQQMRLIFFLTSGLLLLPKVIRDDVREAEPAARGSIVVV